MRTANNEDIKKYERMVNMYLKKMVVKNWNEASMSKSQQDIILGNTGMTVEDIRQHLFTEVCVAISKYDPDYRTKEGKSVLESTFVYQHLFNRIGQMMKKLTKKRYGYGIWTSSIQGQHDGPDGENIQYDYGIDYTDEFMDNIDTNAFKEEFLAKTGKEFSSFVASINEPHAEACKRILTFCSNNGISIEQYQTDKAHK